MPRRAPNIDFPWFFQGVEQKIKTNYASVTLTRNLNSFGLELCPSDCSLATLALEFQISDFRFEISDVRFEISDLRFQMLDVTFQVSDFRFQIWDFRFRISDLGFQISDFRSQI